jgi:Ca2+-binding EF-hand superfamily protein
MSYGQPQRGPPSYGSPYGQPQQGYGGPPPGYGTGYPPQQPGYGSMYPPPGYGTGYQAPGYGTGYPPQQQQQQFGQQYYFAMLSPQEIQELQRSFAAVDKDKSGEISASELASITFGNQRFSVETAQMLVKVFDKDKSGQISFNEFAALHKFIMSMEQAYQIYDKDKSNSIEFSEFQQAVQQGGFNLSPQAQQAVFKRFVNHPSLNPRKSQSLSMELFMQLCAFLGAARSTFQQYDYSKSGSIQLNLDQFVTVLSNTV